MTIEKLHDTGTFAERIMLRHVSSDLPGITRIRRGRGFSFHDPDGRLLEGSDRQRVLDLAVPPAWQDVWICPMPDGHLQAEGTDEAGRRQHRYHDDWTHARRLANFDRLGLIGGRLGDVRREVDRLLDDESARVRATAVMIKLADRGMVRIGNQRSSREHGHHGVSTLLAEHVEVDETGVHLDFLGKSGVHQTVYVDDVRLAEIVPQLEAPTDHLFTVHDDGGITTVTAHDANELLSELSAGHLSCKDFRTWGGSSVALEARVGGADEVQSVDAAAEALGNTRSVARSSYVHPSVLVMPDEVLSQAWASARTSSRYERRERALLKLLTETGSLLDDWLTTR